MSAPDSATADTSLYLVAKGGQPTANKSERRQPRIALLTVLGNKPPANVTINEFTTIASVWTHAQFIDGTAIKGHALGLRIAAGNVPSFVDLADRRLGRTDPRPAEQRPDDDDGQFRHAGRCPCRLRHGGDRRRLRQTRCGVGGGRRASPRPTR